MVYEHLISGSLVHVDATIGIPGNVKDPLIPVTVLAAQEKRYYQTNGSWTLVSSARIWQPRSPKNITQDASSIAHSSNTGYPIVNFFGLGAAEWAHEKTRKMWIGFLPTPRKLRLPGLSGRNGARNGRWRVFLRVKKNTTSTTTRKTPKRLPTRSPRTMLTFTRIRARQMSKITRRKIRGTQIKEDSLILKMIMPPPHPTYFRVLVW
ncbi:hypothetical protein P171DRAFT_479258 [Karstenula rhodostoma CBS 690.94]|uniref:Uncharacterized protein n=1 Tax=Karstenula rhodostoma CBS 690.94 TaxID=1392251 RepID=A0A9P4PRT8_9PLEO|nr:hypothetical protein P171DRAFT_479258 [Karstenula rhodostoma CBS 690.94]